MVAELQKTVQGMVRSYSLMLEIRELADNNVVITTMVGLEKRP